MCDWTTEVADPPVIPMLLGTDKRVKNRSLGLQRAQLAAQQLSRLLCCSTCSLSAPTVHVVAATMPISNLRKGPDVSVELFR